MLRGQNKIDYIVFHKPHDSARLLEKHGYEAPGKVEDLAAAVKKLVQRKGEIAVKDLIQLHPEKKLILELTGHNSDESGYCGCNSSYVGDLKDYIVKLPSMTIAELTDLYEDAKKNASASPEDKTLMAQVEIIWTELKRRRQQEDADKVSKKITEERFYLYLALAFCAGVVLSKLT